MVITMKAKKTFIALLLLLSAVLLGDFVGRLCEGISALTWLSYTISVGVPVSQPFVLDLSVLTFAFGLYLTINIAQIFLLIMALFLYRPLLKKL
ncbi:MAG: DUF4321 domain-containing protein [Acetanaerobacterium sp.]